MSPHSVVIVGGGPTGMMLAAELALAKVDVAIVERRLNQDVEGTRSGGLHARTIEVLEQRGVAERFVSEGQKVQATSFAWIPLDMGDLPTRHNYSLGLWQKDFERILAAWVDELGVRVYRGRDVTGFVQDETGVDAKLSDNTVLRAEYLVGCDGGRSLIRKTAGIEFSGWEPSISCLLAEVELTAEPSWGMHRDALGVHAFGKLGEGKPTRVMVTERNTGSRGTPTLQELSEALVAVYGTDYGVHSATTLSRFTDVTRQAATYRDRRVLLAGDSAHVHFPVGGQGLNLGVQDAVNLGWKLAQVVKRISSARLLDTYQAERHPVAARVLRHTMAAVALFRSDDRSEALRETMTDLLRGDEARRRMVGMLSGLDIHYEIGEGHPLVGRRMPDLDLVTESGPRRAFELLHGANAVLLNLGPPKRFDLASWSDRVRVVDAHSAGPWTLPVLGAVTAPTALFIRPDGYVAWVGDQASQELTDALTRWLGEPA